MVTNQLAANKVTISSAARTVDYLMMRTGTSWSGDSISTYGGTLTMGLASRGIYSEVGYVATGTYLTVPVTAATWSISDLSGNPTTLATINASAVVTATGVDDGKVLVKATLINNPDIFVTRVITLTGQAGKKDAFKMIQLKDNNINSSGMGTATTTYASGGNEIGFYSSTTTSSRAGFRNVVFKGHADRFYIRIASTAAASVAIWIDGYTAATGGTQVGTLALPSTGSNNTYKTYTTALNRLVTGTHDVYLVFSTGATRANWFQFTGIYVDYDATMKSFDFNGETFMNEGDKAEFDVYVPSEKTNITAADFSAEKVKAAFPDDMNVSVALSPADGVIGAGAPCVATVTIAGKEYPQITKTYTIYFGHMTIGTLAVSNVTGGRRAETTVRFSDGVTGYNLMFAVYAASGKMNLARQIELAPIAKHQSGVVGSSALLTVGQGETLKVFLWDQNYIPLVSAYSSEIVVQD
jgi:hypothetical protein